MNVTTLFGNLRDYELDLGRLKDEEEVDKKKKGLALKTSTLQCEVSDEDHSESSENENLKLVVKKFSKFMKKKERDCRTCPSAGARCETR